MPHFPFSINGGPDEIFGGDRCSEKVFGNQHAAPRSAILSTINRADLHALVDSLPEGALEVAKQTLERLQVSSPPEFERMKQIIEQMPKGGTGGCFAAVRQAGGSYGHFGSTRQEDGAAGCDSHHLFDGHEVTATEWLRTAEDGKSIIYSIEATGPKGDAVRKKSLPQSSRSCS